MLFFTKVGQYTEEEFETAFGRFKATDRPFIFTYFKDAPISTGSADRKGLASLWAFQEKLDALGHFYTSYKNIDELKLHFNRQLDKHLQILPVVVAPTGIGIRSTACPFAHIAGHVEAAKGSGSVQAGTDGRW